MSPPDGLGARVDARLTAAGLTTAFRRDCALAVLVAAGTVGLVLLLLADPQAVAALRFGTVDVAVVLVAVTVQGLVLCVRRVRPALCLVVVVALQLVMLPLLPAGGGVRGPAQMVAAYSCGAYLRPRVATWVVGACALAETVVFATVSAMAWSADPAGPPSAAAIVSVLVGQLLSSALLYVASALAGAYVATRRRYVELLRTSAAEAVEAQRARADAAVGRERSRMARELHDIAAHHLSGMVVQAAVVEKLIDRDPAAARRTAAWVRSQGKETLRDLRQVVGALREPDPGMDGAPVPGLGVLDELVRATRETGTPVELVREGTGELAPVADVTFYRVAQEALDNARDHAPGAAVRVRVRVGDGAELDVRNEPGPTGPSPDPDRRGFGLVGMRERAELIGAELATGPTPDGGWRVHLRLPAGNEDTA